MNSIERRDFLRGTATGVFAFSVGGVEVRLSAREAHTQNVPFRLLKANEAKPSRRWATPLFLARAPQALLISSISNSLFRQKKHCSKHASSMFAHPTRASIEVRLPPSTTRAKGLTAAASSWSSVRTSSTIFVDAMRQNKVQGWQGPGGSFVYLLLRSDAVDVVYGTMEGYEALGIPYMPHIAPDKRW